MNDTPLPSPLADDADLVDALGTKGYHDDVALSQFAAWAEHTGLTSLLAQHDNASVDDIVAATELTPAGLEAIGGVLVSVALLERRGEAYALSPLAREYLVPDSPYYQGRTLFLNCRQRLPNAFVKPGSALAEASAAWPARAWRQWRKQRQGWDFGGHRILENQHARNLPAGVAAARLPLFHGAKTVVDMAGGTGTFAIPLAEAQPDTRIIMTDLPQAIPGARTYLERHGVADRVECLGMDAFATPWPLPACDALFFGNFVHGFDDERCLELARNSLETLNPGGVIVWHELPWNADRTGPLKAALFHVTMQVFGGQQRTVAAQHKLLDTAGFTRLFALPTSGGFHAVGGYKPDVP